MPDALRRPPTGLWLLAIAALLAFAIALFNYLSPANGIHGTPGAALVMISTLLMLCAAATLAFVRAASAGVRGTLLLLIALDILGTGLAAYMLEATWLVVAIGAALIGLILHLATGAAQDRGPATPIATGAAS